MFAIVTQCPGKIIRERERNPVKNRHTNRHTKKNKGGQNWKVQKTHIRGISRIPLGGGADPPGEGANIQMFPKAAKIKKILVPRGRSCRGGRPLGSATAYRQINRQTEGQVSKKPTWAEVFSSVCSSLTF